MSVYWTTDRTRRPNRAQSPAWWLVALTAALVVAAALLLATSPIAGVAQRQAVSWLYVDIDHRRITLASQISDDYLLCPDVLDASTCLRVGDLRRPFPAGRRWVVSNEADKRLTVTLEPMPIDWLVCLSTRCGLVSEWQRWGRELDVLHKPKGPVPHLGGPQ